MSQKHTPKAQAYKLVGQICGKDDKIFIETDELDYEFGTSKHFKRIEISSLERDRLVHSSKFRPIDEVLRGFVRTMNENLTDSVRQKIPIPAPWPKPEKQVIEKRVTDEVYFQIDIDGYSWINIHGEKAEGNAAHIVKCVNLHDELVDMLDAIYLNGHIKNEHLNNNVAKLIKRARGES